MVYHSSYANASHSSICSCAVLPVDSIAGFIEEVLDLYRANVLCRNFDVRSDADKLLIYISIFITGCLKKLQERNYNRQEAQRLLYQFAHEPCKAPGEPGFVLGALMTAPASSSEDDFIRSYLRQCREEAGQRLLARCYGPDGRASKFWLAFGSRRFLNKRFA